MGKLDEEELAMHWDALKFIFIRQYDISMKFEPTLTKTAEDPNYSIFWKKARSTHNNSYSYRKLLGSDPKRNASKTCCLSLSIAERIARKISSCNTSMSKPTSAAFS